MARRRPFIQSTPDTEVFTDSQEPLGQAPAPQRRPVQSSDPAPDDDVPPVGIGGSTEKPREVFSTETPREILGGDTPRRPSGSATSIAPSRPKEPSPVAAEPPQPFTPIAPELGPTDLATPGSMLSRSARPSIFPSAGRTPLFGLAGGLMGGGLGVPTVVGGAGSDPSALIATILQILRGR